MSGSAKFSVRIVTADSYMTKPTPGLDPVCSDFGLPIARVPVVRIFGSTPAGQTVCLHVHRVFPYFYVPYDGVSPAEDYLRLFATSLDRALNMYAGDAQDDGDEPLFDATSSKTADKEQQHVYKISIVKGIPFYGFYQDEVMFLKIYFYSAQSIKRAVKLLMNGAVLRKKFQPYESHIPHLLQFFMDYNLQGMNYINASAWELRAVNPEDFCSKRVEYRDDMVSLTRASQNLTNATTYHQPNTQIFANVGVSTNRLKRISSCELEVDVVSDHILNREEIEIKIGTNPGLAVIWRDENARRVSRGLQAVNNLPPSQDRYDTEPAKSEIFFRSRLREKLNAFYSSESVARHGQPVTGVGHFTRGRSSMDDSLLVGVATASTENALQLVNSSFYLDRHTLADAKPSQNSDSVVDAEQIQQLQYDESHDDDLANILYDLAAMVEEERIEGSENGNPLNILQADDEESGKMQETIIFDFDSISDSPEESGNTETPGDAVNTPDILPIDEATNDVSGTQHRHSPVLFEEPTEENSATFSQPTKTSELKEHAQALQPLPDDWDGDVILTPALGFPSRSEIEMTANRHSLQTKWSMYYSALKELGADIAPEKGEIVVNRPTGIKQVREVVEYAGFGMQFKSSALFAAGIRFVKELQLEKQRKLKLIAEERFWQPKRVDGRKVVLTPAIGFPNLSHITRMLDRTGKNKLKSENSSTSLSLFATGHDDDAVASSGESTRSAQKARSNHRFEELVGRNLGTPLAIAEEEELPGDDTAAVLHESENLLLLSLELHADAAKDRCCDPLRDPVRFVVCTLMTDTGDGKANDVVVCICTDSVSTVTARERNTKRFVSWISRRKYFKDLQLWFVGDEQELFCTLINYVRSLDPDILIGYEVQLSSWGYLIERGNALGINVLRLLSRLSKPAVGSKFIQQRHVPQAVAEYEARKMSEFHVVGRVVLNLWRLMRKEVNLYTYSLENVIFHVLKLRFHLFSATTLTEWFGQPLGNLSRWRAMEYVITKSSFNVALLRKLDLIRQTSEFSRLFGIQFYETLTRGSQWRVESMMLRLAKPYNFVPVSPSGDQLKGMAAQECLPLILEPQSRLYLDPVVVLDFQSLYPSMVIAYNYCFSTCLGKVEYMGNKDYFKFGCTAMKISPSFLKEHANELHFSPNGVAFVPKTVRRGILPVMLEEILNTRIMVKKSMESYKNNPVLKKVLHARQLALKLIANVTYGYTSASFSGRMPCVEIGDAIVSKGRETLERAIKFVETTPKWNARVIYGDTDSMFVLLRGRTKHEAFRIGREIEKAITDMNPKPVKLKFEKTKKRYCGFMYENEDQTNPAFDAKGIETVRRDTCPLVSKTLEDMIRMLFARNCDLLSVKQFVQGRFASVLLGDTKMEDFIFAKEYRGRESYKDGASVPALAIAKKSTRVDPRNEPRVGERVPYIITYGDPSRTLLSLVRPPAELFQDPSLRPHGYYYCSRQLVPVLNRILLLLGLDSKKWLFEVQERLLSTLPRTGLLDSCINDLPYFYKFCTQALLGRNNFTLMVNNKKVSRGAAAEQFYSDCKRWETAIAKATAVCQGCMGTQSFNVECESFDCPVMFELLRASDRLARLKITKHPSAYEL
ncbi:DNA polymerase zeta catalytic subunit-like isoform X2 [Paramacrobiotus metropolitanus]|uniref:DNA polymerase zeta catalytic subunit-like isoform X2 n=1 Tax=Paramacrobiotus metropolitanus TaxID=2943436 RepID=UPI002445D80E|nr:DNA polymerase zeta catalytic subunit-like isoform X2 [Paramacrobiotus metropolitanus]